MRRLNGNDVFKMSKILKKINVSLDMEGITTSNLDVESVQINAGISMFKSALENLHLAQYEVNEFLGSLVGCSAEEFGNKDLDEYTDVVIEFKEMIEGSNFLKLVKKLM